MFDAVAWWLAVEVVGLVSLPLTFLLLRRLPDAGYAFTKPLGLLIGGYAFWLALSVPLLPKPPGRGVLVFLAVGAGARLSGSGVSYYYFGYVSQAMLGKLAAVPTSVAYNLGLAGTAALAATAAFGLAYNLVSLGRRVGATLALAVGGAGALLLTVLGNLEGVLEFAAANGVGSAAFFRSLGIKGLEAANESATWYPTEQSSFWWWWRATRISPDGSSITEFPFFSFLLGDLHPHVMAIPFVLTVIGLGLVLWRSESPLSFNAWRRQPAALLVVAVMLGGLGFLNTWDLPT